MVLKVGVFFRRPGDRHHLGFRATKAVFLSQTVAFSTPQPSDGLWQERIRTLNENKPKTNFSAALQERYFGDWDGRPGLNNKCCCSDLFQVY